MKKFQFSTVIVFLLFLTFPLVTEDVIHILKKGETLYGISRKYNVPLTQLMEQNSIVDSSKVKENQKIIISKSSKSSSNTLDAKGSEYIVQSGDTLYSIAKKHDITLNELKKMNSLSDTTIIKPGKVLIVSKKEDAVLVVKDDPRSMKPKKVDTNILWPVPTQTVSYLTGKLYGVAIDTKKDESVKSIASGRVVSKGPLRGYGQVIFVQSKQDYVYVYGGMDSILPNIGDTIKVGENLGRLGSDALSGKSRLYFMVYEKNKPINPADAPRGY